MSVLGQTVLNSRTSEQEAIGQRIKAAKIHLDMEMTTNHFVAYVDDEAAKMQEAIEDAAEEEMTETLAGQAYDGWSNEKRKDRASFNY